VIVNPGRQQLGAVAGGVIDKILASLNGLLMTEHNQDGTHANVTATGLAVSKLVAFTGYKNIAATAQINDLLIPDVTVLRFNLTGAQNLTGLDATGRVMGSVVMICNVTASVDHLTILLEDTSSIAKNRFSRDGSIGGDSIDLAPGRFLWAMYDTVSTRWRVGTGFG